MKKEEIKYNGIFLWSKTWKGIYFARQLEPTEGLMGDNKDPLASPIYIGKEGEIGRDLHEVLEENEKLKEENTNLKNAIYEDEQKKWYELDRRLTRIETRKSWWKKFF